MGADCARVIDELARQLHLRPLEMTTVSNSGTKSAAIGATRLGSEEFQGLLRDTLSENDDTILKDYLMSPETLTAVRLNTALQDQVSLGLVHPVYFGSASTGAGIDNVQHAIKSLLPAFQRDSAQAISGKIFKIDRVGGGEKVSYVYLHSGTISARQSVDLPSGPARVTAIRVYRDGAVHPSSQLHAGEIGQVSGLVKALIGDVIGLQADVDTWLNSAPPTLETRISPTKLSERTLLWAALTQLAEQDPLINLRKSDDGSQPFVSLYGEVQKEVIKSTLLSEFEVEAVFGESTVICVERLVTFGTGLELIFKDPNPYLATVGIRVEPKEIDSGTTFALEVDAGQMPTSFYKAIEDTVFDTLKQGPHGWEIVDCHIALTAVQQSSPSTSAADFRQLTPLVLAAAISNAKTVVCEPMDRFRIDAPASTLSNLVASLTKLGGSPQHLQ